MSQEFKNGALCKCIQRSGLWTWARHFTYEHLHLCARLFLHERVCRCECKCELCQSICTKITIEQHVFNSCRNLNQPQNVSWAAGSDAQDSDRNLPITDMKSWSIYIISSDFFCFFFEAPVRND